MNKQQIKIWELTPSPGEPWPYYEGDPIPCYLYHEDGYWSIRDGLESRSFLQTDAKAVSYSRSERTEDRFRFNTEEEALSALAKFFSSNP